MKCEHEVRVIGLNFLRVRQCKHEATVERGGKWLCKTHDPIQMISRQTKRDATKTDKNKTKHNLYRAQLIAKSKRKNGEL